VGLLHQILVKKKWLLYFTEFCWFFNGSFWLLVLPHENLVSAGLMAPLISDANRVAFGPRVLHNFQRSNPKNVFFIHTPTFV